MSEGPWKLILHGNEQYPYPLSIHTADGKYWVTRDGTVSSLDRARLMTAAPEVTEYGAAYLEHSRAWIGVLVERLQEAGIADFDDVDDVLANKVLQADDQLATAITRAEGDNQ